MDSPRCEVEIAIGKKRKKRCQSFACYIVRKTAYARYPKDFHICAACYNEMKIQMGAGSVQIMNRLEAA